MSQAVFLTPSSGPGSGTVTSISAGTGITLTPNPITTTGTVALTVPVVIANGGTNAITFATTDGTIYYDGTRLVTTATGSSGQVLTSNGIGVAPSYQSLPAAGVTSITGTANQITASSPTGAVTLSIPSTFIAPGSIASTTTVTAGTGLTVTVGNINLPETTTSTTGILNIGVQRFLHAYGANTDANTFVGQAAGNFTLTSGSSQLNVGIGSGSLSSLTTGFVNTAIGYSAGNAISTGQYNVFAGGSAGALVTTGTHNTMVGGTSGSLLLTGQYNTLLGASTGATYTSSESSNILIGHTTVGTTGESNVCRIGNSSGTGAGQIAQTFIAGISGVSVSNLNYVTIDTSTGQMGSASSVPSSISITGDSGGALTGAAFTFTGASTGLTFSGSGTTETLTGTLVVANGGTGVASFNTNGVLISNTTGTGTLSSLSLTSGQVVIGGSGAPAAATLTPGTGISISNGNNAITIATTGTTTLTYTNVNTSPYVVLSTDAYLSVDCSGGAITLQFPNAATLGRTYIVKDRTGSANANNITITTVGGAVNIDGATTYIMNTQYASIQLIGNGSTYEIY